MSMREGAVDTLPMNWGEYFGALCSVESKESAVALLRQRQSEIKDCPNADGAAYEAIFTFAHFEREPRDFWVDAIVDLVGEGKTASYAREVIARERGYRLKREAEARLHKAAPSLLAALKAMCVSHENLYRCHFGEASDPMADLIRKEAEAAIAEAEDRTA